MPEKSEYRRTHPAEPVIVLYLFLVVATILLGILSGFYDALEERFGFDLKGLFSDEVTILPLGEGISLGDEVVTRDITPVFREPGDSTPLFSAPAGSVGKVIDGPVVIDGVTWWKVRFDDGSVGWVRGDDLIGSEVVTNGETLVYSSPGDLVAAFSVPKGTIGKIIGGPVVINGVTWWKVRFDDGSEGWVKEDSLGAVGGRPLFARVISVIKTIATYVSLVFLTLLIYSYVRFRQVKADEDRKFKFANYYEPDESEFTKNDRWERVVALTDSDNPSDWKQAIIETDIILDELVTAQGYEGAGLGDKLKGINPGRLSTLNSAWEAHKVRNRIAHDGGDFVLTQHEAKRVVNLYAAVFRELGFL